ncbi:tetratricopeptide repeat-containing diguanylate cyclase [Gammaproteobacteria bacterium AB-CW1]|uniref:diguanylate cyclase n=1 Tax=Natronospira elongata TaxID=3110268 RepID=A0AAP6JEB9_9GAMM|nr:tetratricopeptide repeat-containing diguanylate cyclase [Gammaproteobacteria bacterium AB-CW1]
MGIPAPDDKLRAWTGCLLLGLLLLLTAMPVAARAAQADDIQARLAAVEDRVAAAEQVGDFQQLAEAEIERAQINQELERPSLARQAFQRALDAFRRSEDQVGALEALTGLGNTLTDLEEYDRALEVLYDALRLADNLEKPQAAGELEARIGEVHFHTQDLDAAENYFQRMRERFEGGDYQEGYASALNNLAVIARHHQDLARAEALNRESLAIREAIGDSEGMAASYNNLAVVAWLEGELAETERWHQRALALYKEVGNRRGEARSLHNLGYTYILQEDFPRAEEYLAASWEIIEEIDSDNLRVGHFNRMAELHAARGDYPAALEARTRQLELVQELQGEHRQRQIAEMRALFQADEREQEIRLLEQERQTQRVVRNALLIGALGLALILILLWNRFLIKSRSNRLIAARNDELNAMDRLVAALNNEEEFASLLSRILEEATDFFEPADRGAFMVRSPEGTFYPAVWKGFRYQGIRKVRLSEAEARARYLNDAESLCEGVYLRRRPEGIRGHESLQKEDPSLAMLAIAITMDGEVAGYLILQSQKYEDAFNVADRDSYRRFREHAVSAFRRARHLEQLAVEKEAAEHARCEMERLARSDSLTALPNRRCMQERLDDEWVRIQRSQRPAALILCDIDHFKRINDSLGHEAGDAVLQAVAAQFRERLRAQDSVARWGGEEFLILLPETDTAGAVELAEALRARIAASEVPYQDDRIAVNLSFGVAPLDPAQAVENSIRRADEALYAGKRGGRNRVIAAPDLPAGA